MGVCERCHPERSEGPGRAVAPGMIVAPPAPQVPRYARDDRRSNPPHRQKGFTLIELIIVVTIIGILAGIAMVQVRNMQRKARETALMDNLHQMRKAIDNFYADKQRFPSTLDELVPDYLRKIPPDPITEQTDWDQVVESPDPDAPQETDEFGSPAAPGVIDVKSKAQGTTLNGTPYSEL